MCIAGLNTPVTPNCDFTATFGDFKFGLVAVGRCVVAFDRRLAVTPKQRSQQIAAFLRYSKCQSPDCAATVQRVHYDCITTSATARCAVVVWSYDLLRSYIEYAAITASIDRPYCDLCTTCHRLYCDRQR